MGAPAGHHHQLQVMAVPAAGAGGAGAADKAVAKPVRAGGGQVVLADALRSRLFSAAAGERRGAAAAAADERANYMSSSGSEHEPSSVCLAAMVHDFMQEGEGVHAAGAAGGVKAAATAAKCGRPRCNCDNGVCDALSQPSDSEDAKSVVGKELTEMIQSLAPAASPLEKSLLLDTTQAVAKVKEEASLICKDGADTCTNCLRRLVMGELRRRGYNAAICKARWDHAGGYPGGDYEYIDVVVEGAGAGAGASASTNNSTNTSTKEERLLVDLDFRAQFEIARPTNSYQALLHSLPPVFAGTPERVHQLVKIMSDGARRSLKKRGLYLPPWRKPEYMRAKWLSAYRRTTNPVPPEHLLVDRDRDAVGSLAVRGHGWDERFRTAMESHYHRHHHQDKQQPSTNVNAAEPEEDGTSSSGNNVGSGVHQQQREQEEDPALQQQLRKPLGSALTAQFKAMAAAAQSSSTTTAQGRHRPPDYLLTHQPQQQQAAGARYAKTTSTSTTVTAFTGGVQEGLHQHHHRHHQQHQQQQAQQQQQQQQAQAAAAAAKEAELEGRVRGANKMLFSRAINDPTTATTTTTTLVSDLVVGGGTELHIRDNSEWKFPAVKPRSPHRTRMVTGLSSMLSSKGRQQQQQQQQPQQQPLLAAAV